MAGVNDTEVVVLNITQGSVIVDFSVEFMYASSGRYVGFETLLRTEAAVWFAASDNAVLTKTNVTVLSVTLVDTSPTSSDPFRVATSSGGQYFSGYQGGEGIGGGGLPGGKNPINRRSTTFGAIGGGVAGGVLLAVFIAVWFRARLLRHRKIASVVDTASLRASDVHNIAPSDTVPRGVDVVALPDVERGSEDADAQNSARSVQFTGPFSVESECSGGSAKTTGRITPGVVVPGRLARTHAVYPSTLGERL